MDNFLPNSFPENIKKEIDAINKLVMPLAKKTSKYMFWTFPLIGVSIINIIYLLFMEDRGNDLYVMLFIYALMGAVGLALLKETKINKKEIERIGLRYILERIRRSSIISDDRKNYYIHSVKEEPVHAMENFVKFLQEEERMNRWKNYQRTEMKVANDELEKSKSE